MSTIIKVTTNNGDEYAQFVIPSDKIGQHLIDVLIEYERAGELPDFLDSLEFFD